MSMHMPLPQFSVPPAASVQPVAPFSSVSASSQVHPLANPHVLLVVPFWLQGEARRCDLDRVCVLFDGRRRIGDNSLLMLGRERVSAAHGESVAADLEGRTGLYVVVKDLERLRENVCGTIRSIAQTPDGILELVMETGAGLIIFAQKAKPLAVAA